MGKIVSVETISTRIEPLAISELSREDDGSESELFAWLTAAELPVEAAIGLNLVALSNIMERSASRITGRHRLTLPQWMALRTLWQAGPEGLSLTRLSRCLLLSKAPITGIMDRLEKHGLARREPDLQDRRVVRAVITEAGIQRFEQVKSGFIEWKERAYASLTEEERSSLLRLLHHLLLQSLAQPEAATKKDQP
jgi:MarR family 2-MHQ and catechol resistance regulon transcriptional repressor